MPRSQRGTRIVEHELAGANFEHEVAGANSGQGAATGEFEVYGTEVEQGTEASEVQFLVETAEAEGDAAGDGINREVEGSAMNVDASDGAPWLVQALHVWPPAGRGFRRRPAVEVVARARAIRARSAPSWVSW